MKIIYLFLVSVPMLVSANTLAPVQPITSSNGANISLYPCYNSQTNQFFASWYGSGPSLDFSIFNADGSVAVPTTLLFSDGVNPYGSVIASYNNHNNQYFLSFTNNFGGYVQFCTLNDQGGIVQTNTTISTVTPNNFPFNCFNSINNQYFVSWASGAGDNYFAIIDEDGTVSTVSQIPNVDSLTTTTDLICCYNTTNNQYFLCWIGSDQYPYFAILNANGTIFQAASPISNTLTPNSELYCCYNSTTNQYLITFTNFFIPYLTIMNADGTISQPPEEIPSGTQVSSAIFCSYNSLNNQYLITYVGAGEDASNFMVLDAHGEIVIEETPIPNLDSTSKIGPLFTSYGKTGNEFFIPWFSNNLESYYTLYQVTSPILPPLNLSGARILNRFANYGEYFNRLQWNSPSNSGVAGYRVYREGNWIATLPSTQTSYENHNQPKAPITYEVTSIDREGNESTAVSITL